MLGGVRLVSGAIGLFLVPVVLAIAGASVSRTTGTGQLVGGLIGLTTGMAAAVLIAGRVRPSRKDCP